jgi:hypothetical protein
MKTFNKYFIFFYIFCLVSCNSIDIEDANVIETGLTDISSIEADGKSSFEVVARLNNNTAEDRNKIKFTIENGIFENGMTEYIATSVYIPENKSSKLVAKAICIVSKKANSQLKILAMPEFKYFGKQYIVSDLVFLKSSVPRKITLNTDLIHIRPFFRESKRVYAVLKNETGKPPSDHYVVRFRDILSNGNPAHGKFTYDSLFTTKDTLINFYQADSLAQFTNIYIIAEQFDSMEQSSPLRDSLKLIVDK